MYDGYPWLVIGAVWLKPRHEYVVKAVFEPVLLFFAGALLCQLSEPLGAFVMFGGVPLFLKKAIERGIDNVHVRAMKDQAIEMRLRAERFRSRPF